MLAQKRGLIQNMLETKRFWLTVLIVFVVYTAALLYYEVSYTHHSVNLTPVSLFLSSMIGIIIFYEIYKVQEIPYDIRSNQIVSIFVALIIVSTISMILFLGILSLFSFDSNLANNSYVAFTWIGLLLFGAYLYVFIIIFAVLSVFGVLGYNRVHEFIAAVIYLGLLFLVYSQYYTLIGFGLGTLLAGFGVVAILYQVYMAQDKNKQEILRSIPLTPNICTVIYVFSLLIFFLTYQNITSSSNLNTCVNPIGSVCLPQILMWINLLSIAVMLFLFVFMCMIFLLIERKK